MSHSYRKLLNYPLSSKITSTSNQQIITTLVYTNIQYALAYFHSYIDIFFDRRFPHSFLIWSVSAFETSNR